MCLEVSKVFKCGCEVVVRNIFCPDSLDRNLCVPVETMKKHLSQRCLPCYKRLVQGWNTTAAKAAPKLEIAPAAAVKSNTALAAAMPVGGSNKRKAAPEPEQERPAKKVKTEAEVKREHELEQKVDQRKKQKELEYQRQYRQKQVLQKKRKQEQVVLEAMALVAEAMDLAQRAGAEAAALVRARAKAQAQHDEELEADLEAAFAEEELYGEEPALTFPPALTPAAPLVEGEEVEVKEVKDGEAEEEEEEELEAGMLDEKEEKALRYLEDRLCLRCMMPLVEAELEANDKKRSTFLELQLDCLQCLSKHTQLAGVSVDEDENEDESYFKWESDRDSSSSDTASSLTSPALLELRGEPLRYLMPVAELVPCHGYYFKIPSLQPHSAPEQAHCCANCFQLEHVDEEGMATLMRAYDMFDGGYWSEG